MPRIFNWSHHVHFLAVKVCNSAVELFKTSFPHLLKSNYGKLVIAAKVLEDLSISWAFIEHIGILNIEYWNILCKSLCNAYGAREMWKSRKMWSKIDVFTHFPFKTVKVGNADMIFWFRRPTWEEADTWTCPQFLQTGFVLKLEDL